MPDHTPRHCRFYDFVSETGSPIDGRPVCKKGCDLTPLGSWAACIPSPVIHCAVREEMTDEEFAARSADRMALLTRCVLLHDAIPASRRGDCGTMPCPNCEGGTVRWFDELRTGRLSAACSTPNCCWVIE